MSERMMRRWIAALGPALLFTACGVRGGNEPAARPAPRVEVRSDDPRLDARGDRLRLGDSLFSGEVVERDPAGRLLASTPYVDGLIEGTMRGWYADGTRMYERPYVAGRREGEHVGWWENGRLRFRYSFSADLHEGAAEEFFPDGRRYRLFNYRHGAEEGRQRIWDPDGTLYANYMVIDGRRYGSIGTKPCISYAADRPVRTGGIR